MTVAQNVGEWAIRVGNPDGGRDCRMEVTTMQYAVHHLLQK